MQIISDVNTYFVLIFIEKGLELHIDKNFQKILGLDCGILKKYNAKIKYYTYSKQIKLY